MTTYIIVINTLNVSLRFSIVSDPKVDALSPKSCKGDLAFSEIYAKVLPALARQERYILAGLVSDELNSSQSYCEGDSETADDVITLTVEETSQGLHHVV